MLRFHSHALPRTKLEAMEQAFIGRVKPDHRLLIQAWPQPTSRCFTVPKRTQRLYPPALWQSALLERGGDLRDSIV